MSISMTRVFLCCILLTWSASAMAQDEAGDEPQAETDGGAAEAESSEAPAPESTPKMQKGTYTVRLKDLESRVNRLKEQIFRSKARLSLLAETVLDRKIAGAKAMIVFRNEMGGSFRLVKAIFLLDGAPIFTKSDESDDLSDRDMINLFDGPVMPGDHTLSAVLHYRGHGYGIFSYLKGYSFKTRSSRTFTVNEGKALKLEVVGYEKGGVTTPLEERPDVRYIMNMADYEGASVEESNSESAEEGKE
ncbi:MAG: hypothetical protein GY854_16390 [Deltaproteobacteria bacterium]|nr:hypothetical protein [Deltaproteobacteria bacterium]